MRPEDFYDDDPYEFDPYEGPCPECGGTGISTCRVEEPDGEGGAYIVIETCICPSCQ